MELQFTLLSDGSSDGALLPILTWALRAQLPTAAINSVWADLRRMPRPPSSLADRILASINLYPCDILFVHRDAEKVPPADRLAEIDDAVSEARQRETIPKHIRVVPVRMREAWLLIDEHAIRSAALNPNGRQELEIPALNELENLPDPKSVLYKALRDASGLRPHRLKGFFPPRFAYRIPQFLDDDFSPLRCLKAFQQLETDIQDLIRANNWS